MEAIIFCGLQASGKSSFYKEHFFTTHLRINLDMLRTRKREKLIFEACLTGGQRFVIDNTNPVFTDRQLYIEAAKRYHFTVVGYYFSSSLEDCLERNAQRVGKARIPDKGLIATHNKFQKPCLDEGYEKLYEVILREKDFEVNETL